mgnify:CR=1 FL=1
MVHSFVEFRKKEIDKHSWWFSPTSLTGGGHDQLIRESIPPPFSPGFWDGVGSPLNVGPCAHKRPERK